MIWSSANHLTSLPSLKPGLGLMTPLPSYLTSHHLVSLFCMYRVTVDLGARLDCLFLMRCLFRKLAYPTSLSLKQSATQYQRVQERLASLSTICMVHLVQILSFFGEFQNILSSLTTSCMSNLVITGDFNFHINTNSHCTKVFHDILSSFDLQKVVSFPIHSHGYTLDLLIASSACTFTSIFQSDCISDHFTVIGVMSFLVFWPAYHKTISYGNLKSIELDVFDVTWHLNSDLFICPADNAADLANQYNSVLSSILDKHTPLKSRRVSGRPDNPWMPRSIIEAKRHRRYLERTWRHNPTPLTRSRLTNQTNVCTD